MNTELIERLKTETGRKDVIAEYKQKPWRKVDGFDDSATLTQWNVVKFLAEAIESAGIDATDAKIMSHVMARSGGFINPKMVMEALTIVRNDVNAVVA